MNQDVKKALVLGAISVATAALVAYSKSPKGQKAIKDYTKKAKRYAQRYAKQIEIQLK